MKTQIFKSLGLEIPYTVAESEAEYNQLANREGRLSQPNACLDEAVASMAYRSLHPLFAKKLAEQLEALPEQPYGARKRDKKENGKEEIQDARKWLAEVRAEKCGGNWPEQIQKLAKEIGPTIEFDPSRPIPGAKQSSSKEDLLLADTLLALDKEVLNKKLAGLGLPTDASREAVASAIRDRRLAKAAEKSAEQKLKELGV